MATLFDIARKATAEKPEAVTEALRLYCGWSGARPDNGLHYRAAVSIGVGRTPSETASRMLATRIVQAMRRSERVFHDPAAPSFLIGM